jgi:hypothetical protein
MSQPEVQVKYDTERVVTRFVLALLPCVGYILTFHGFSRAVIPPPCSGGWLEAIQFVAVFFLTATIIELAQWALWNIWKRARYPVGDNALTETDSVVFSGGGLFLLPRKSLWSVFATFACFFIFLWAGTPNPCENLNFSWRAVLGCFSFAYSALGFGSFVEFYDRGPNPAI